MADRRATRRLPGEYGTSGWWATLPPPSAARVLERDETADFLVLGAGFTGLAAARRLAELRPDDRVVVVEAQRVGYGSSGRNSGFVVDVGHWAEKWGVEGNARRVRLQRAGRQWLGELVAAHGVRCDFSEIGRYHVAVNDVGRAALARFRRGLEVLGEPYEDVSREALRARTGSAYYDAAIFTAGSALVQPAALARGLGASLPPNVSLFEQSPVTALDLGPPHRAECERGSVSAPVLVLATNGFTPQLGFLERRIVPLMTFASLTRPLSESERSGAGDGEWGLVPEEALGSTVRRTRDHRLLMRNTVRYLRRFEVSEREWERIRSSHGASLRARFPELADVELEHTWGGVMGNTLNDGQHFGELRAGVFSSAAYNGVGVAMGTAAGRALAELVLGGENEAIRDLRALDAPSWIPWEPLLGLGVRSTIGYRQWRAGTEY